MNRRAVVGWCMERDNTRLQGNTELPEIVLRRAGCAGRGREKGPEVADIDPDRVGMVGHSAGGYLTLKAGTFPNPPKVLVSFYGYGDIVGAWY
jgi:hypothetical protein